MGLHVADLVQNTVFDQNTCSLSALDDICLAATFIVCYSCSVIPCYCPFPQFEELPVRPKTEDTDYVRVNPLGAARNSEKFGQGGLLPCNYDNMCGDAAQSSSGCANNMEDDDDEDEVTYTHVIIKPKHRL